MGHGRIAKARSLPTSTMRKRLPIFTILLSAACAGPTEARPPETLLAIAPKTTALDAGLAKPPDAVHLEVTEADGLPRELVAHVYEAAREPLQGCRQSGGGKVNVRITRREGLFHLSVEPGASLDPSARHCVLEALSTVDLEETGGNVGGPTIRPSGFTSLITVSW
jgi:hypothetical protein